jgi:hypothetical protein
MPPWGAVEYLANRKRLSRVKADARGRARQATATSDRNHNVGGNVVRWFRKQLADFDRSRSRIKKLPADRMTCAYACRSRLESPVATQNEKENPSADQWLAGGFLIAPQFCGLTLFPTEGCPKNIRATSGFP